MIIRFIKPDVTANSAKLTVHKTGKLGLSKGAMELLNTAKNRFVRFGFGEDDQLLMEVSHDAKENSFPIGKAGDYDYINARTMLDELGVDYMAKQTIIYDIKKTAEEGFFRLHQRVIKK
ncbi:hypothetical protein CO230_05315 [Chryseobacterium sp. 6424]|uniref:hypothetical protein n=1 Tax=Chryseobacterium sp. 6424 TaxID=2039166 RepID=UPI000EFB9658|nr:hypothetical protein [Chryseobacterium sp. 6424]AYO57590.1 hypothetical protein CO230_05315 [Chryseobacterium sp. 6424]